MNSSKKFVAVTHRTGGPDEALSERKIRANRRCMSGARSGRGVRLGWTTQIAVLLITPQNRAGRFLLSRGMS